MAAQTLCLFNKFGFCKYGERCRKHHVHAICERSSCDVLTCSLRHPNVCTFYRDLGRCKFDPCAFLHIENENSLDSLKKQINEILEKISKLDDTIKELDNKIIESKLLQEKLKIVENKMDHFKSFESDAYKKDCLIEELTKKVSAIENNLQKKDEIIESLSEKVKALEERQEFFETESHEISKSEQTFMNPSDESRNCNNCALETTSKEETENHLEKLHVNNLNCEYCDFHAKNVGGLKIHIRRMHSLEKNLFQCEYCTFTSKTEREMKTHKRKYNITHSKLDYNEHLEELNCEIFALKEIGFMLLGMQHYDSYQWKQWMDASFMTLGKNPR